MNPRSKTSLTDAAPGPPIAAAAVPLGCVRALADIMWLDPAAYRRWRDVGLLGQDLSGRVEPAWRGRDDQRNAAFCDLLNGTDLRLVEGRCS
jgi:hypothetical protein